MLDITRCPRLRRIARVRNRLDAAVPLLLTSVFVGGCAAPPPPADSRVTAGLVMPVDRMTRWAPGIEDGVPSRTRVCATIDAGPLGDGAQDATAAIQQAIDACPEGEVVQLSSGVFRIEAEHPVTIGRGVVLRGAGAARTVLRKTTETQNPLIVIGRRWLEEEGSVPLTADAANGAMSVEVSSVEGLSPGQLVLVDSLADERYVYWGDHPALVPGGPARSWFTRPDRPVGQVLEVDGIDGRTVSFTAPLHLGVDVAHAAQLTRWRIPYGAALAGVEDLAVDGGRDDNITMRLCKRCWITRVDSRNSGGDSIAIDTSFRGVLRDSYVHDTVTAYPGGGGYLLSVSQYTADSLVENNIIRRGNKVMVMKASGGGNVIAYNYFDDGYIEGDEGWVETGLNASHMTCPHFELFEGNQAFNADGDDTWGGAVYNTFFRNHLTGHRASFDDRRNRRAVGLMRGHYFYSFVGNVLGEHPDLSMPGRLWARLFGPASWRLGYTPGRWRADVDARVVETVFRHGNFDAATGAVEWAAGYDTDLPASLYLDEKPAFFGDAPWPWVDAAGTTKVHSLPARVRFDAGRPIP